MALSRRTLLLSSAAVGRGGRHELWPLAASAAPYRGPLRADPFTLGVASGDPEPRRLRAVDPAGPDSRSPTTAWAACRTATCRCSGSSPPTPALPPGRPPRRHGRPPAAAHTVHVELHGLPPAREYFYRFKADRYVSPAGRTRTAPAPWASGGTLAMSFVSCSQFEHGYFTAYRRLAEDEPDLILHLGDYQYEYAPDTYTIPGGNPRDHEGPETVTLANYRQRHAQYKTDPDLQAAHAVAPWAVVFDDHEIENNWADEVPEQPDPDFLARRAAAFQAYYENMPLRRTSIPRGIDMQLYRRLHWGRLATFHLLDTRQFRDDQACGDGYKDCPAGARPGPLDHRRGAGEVAAGRLPPLDGPLGHPGPAGLLRPARQQRGPGEGGQHGLLGRLRGLPRPHHPRLGGRGRPQPGRPDRRRARPLGGRAQAGLRRTRPHARWARSWCARRSPPRGTGSDVASGQHPWAAWNPHLRFYNNQRGYVRTKITKDAMTADFQVLPYVTRPGAPVHTRATFVIEDRVPGLHQVADNPTPGGAALRGGDLGAATVRQETDRP